MKKIIVKIVKENGVEIPKYMTDGAAGLDVKAYITNEIVLNPLERVLVPTGLKIEIPVGYEVQVRPRSGLALKHGITLVNSPGTIDSDYRGELKMILINLSNEKFTILPNERIAQLVLQKVCQMEFEEVEKLSDTKRADGGFGSTGK